jgi:predicted RNase H-like nuclease
MRRVVGLDGCPAGWVAVLLEDGVLADIRVVASVAESLAAHEPSVVGVDMPVGLVDAIRDTDVAARALLPGRASSVFSTAPRSVVAGFLDGSIVSHAQASERCRAVTGQGLSQQAWRLVPKMAEVDAAAASGAPLTEVHPELAFTTIAGVPLPRKRSWPGIALRRALLEELGVVLPDRFSGDTAAAPDDVVDAAVCAWVADGLAGAAGELVRVPTETTQRAFGREIVITARRRP